VDDACEFNGEERGLEDWCDGVDMMGSFLDFVREWHAHFSVEAQVVFGE